MKYIVFAAPDGARFPLIFPEYMVHYEVARVMEKSEACWPVSAGFFDPAQCLCHGESESLNLKGAEMDLARIVFGDAVRYIDDGQLAVIWRRYQQVKNGEETGPASG